MSNTSTPKQASDGDTAAPSARRFRIEEVRRETGVPKETLRIWERRYAFPRPGRDPAGERLYSQTDIDKLKLMKKLVDRGHRPSVIVGHSQDALHALLVESEEQRPHPRDGHRIEPLLHALKSHDVQALRDELNESMHRQGLELFVLETVAPLTAAVGAMWVVGDIEVFEEHLYSEVIQSVLRDAMHALPTREGKPRVLLTTPQGEQHQLGLLMAQVLLALEGAQCISLGTQTPHRDIAKAAIAHRAEVVALSISSSYAVSAASQLLDDLDRLLPGEVEVWIGGGATRALGNLPVRVRLLSSLNLIRSTLQSWRALHLPRPA